MSGFPGPTESNGLSGLLAQLRQQHSKPELQPSYNYYPGTYYGQPQPQQAPSHGYQHPSVSSPLPTPTANGQQPHHSSAVMSPVQTPQPRVPAPGGGATNADRTSSLLNLLKFSQPSASSSAGPSTSAKQPTPIGHTLPASRDPSLNFGSISATGQVNAPAGHGRGSNDLLAALISTTQGKAPQQASPQFIIAQRPVPTAFEPAPPTSDDTQTYLLSLLNKPKPSQTDATPPLQPAKILTPPSRAINQQDDVGNLAQTLEDTVLSGKGSTASEGKSVASMKKENSQDVTPRALFTYVNPFEQLAASSPRPGSKPSTPAGPSTANTPAITILKRGEASDNKRKMDERSTISSPAHTKRRIEPPSQASSPPTPLPDGRTKLEALIGIGASSGKETANKETVSDALQDVGNQVDQEVQQAIARAENDEKHAKQQQSSVEQDLRKMLDARSEKEFEKTAKDIAVSLKKELDRDSNKNALESLSTPVAEFVKDVIDDAAKGHLADSWESADADAEAEEGPVKDDKEDEDSRVTVYNFPMKPWTSITIKDLEVEPRPSFQDEVVLDIARLKKEFDQNDRALVGASNTFIVYGMSKNGGIRVIRQDDGRDAKLFTETQDRIYNVAISTSSIDKKETIIGTSVNGVVYWASIKDGEVDCIGEGHPETRGFALPPIPTQESEPLGSILKTRARKSSTHPEFFAVGRGRSIHVVWPAVIMKGNCFKNAKDRVVEVGKYLAKQSLKINTGKAGKDFTFSEDDTTIVSLDKAGRVKFWDVREFTKCADESSSYPSQTGPMEINEPLMTLNTTPAFEKAWPTSLLLIDKQRPYQRGGSLRYMIVGMKQNHTLQLWDLALQRAVQEIHLPHSKESDAVCSVLYHAATGMIIVGHPTRNSIYFLHLSAPKYQLSKYLTQVEYINKLCNDDPSTPRPDSTAVFSGMREYSFANKGMLRSLELLQNPDSEVHPSTMFELYAMHSKGVTCLNIKQADLGWDRENKVNHSIDAEDVDLISIETIKEIPAPSTPPESVIENQPPSTPQNLARNGSRVTANGPKEILKKINHVEPPSTTGTPKIEDNVERENLERAASSGTDKKKRRKGNLLAEPAAASSSSNITTPIKNIVVETPAKSESTTSSKMAPELIFGRTSKVSDVNFDGLSEQVTRDVEKLLGKSFSSLAIDLKEDRRTQAAVAEAKQDAMLRLVSKTLSDNVENTLARIVSDDIKAQVLPSMANSISKSLKDVTKEHSQLGAKINTQIAQSVPRELQKVLPDAICKALQNPQLLKLMSDSLARSVAFKVEEQFASVLHSQVTPAFTQLAVTTAQRVSVDIQQQAEEQIGNIERQRQSDSVQIQQLTELVTRLSQTVASMAETQAEFQGQFLNMQKQAALDRQTVSSQTTERQSEHPSTSLTGPIERKSEDMEYTEKLQAIKQAMNEGKYEQAVINWLQTGREQEFYRNYFVKYNADFLQSIPLLVLLSLGAMLTAEFGDLLHERLNWIETVLAFIASQLNTRELKEGVQDLVPKILQIYIQRLEHLFMSISNVNAQDPLLKRVSQLVTSANRIVDHVVNFSSQLQQI